MWQLFSNAGTDEKSGFFLFGFKPYTIILSYKHSLFSQLVFIPNATIYEI